MGMKGLRIFYLGCALLTAYCAAALWRERHNTLNNYPEWRSEKAELALGVNGARSFTVTPISLLGRALDLSAWHGYQEVSLVEAWEEFPEIRLKVYSDAASEWNMIARSLKGEQDFALRLSNHKNHPSAWLKLGPEREFLEKRTIDQRLPAGRWIEVSLRRAEGRLELFVDQERLSSADWPGGPWQISFRGNSQQGKLKIDDIELKSRASVYAQRFSGQFPLWLFLPLVFVVLGFLVLAKSMAGELPAFAAAVALGCASILSVYFYERTFGQQYPANVNFLGKITNIETREEAHKRLSSLRAGRSVVLWLGGSQAWGAGASTREKSAFARLSAEFAGQGVDFVNGAVSAATLEDQLEVLRIVSARRSLAAVVITTGVNDANNSAFPEKLKLIAEAVRKRGARLLLVPEPTTSPVPPVVKRRHDELIRFASAEDIPYLDLPAVMEREADSGYLWWDCVHLSDAGAAVVARAVSPALKTILEGPAKKGKR